jgi:hypothetical protein
MPSSARCRSLCGLALLLCAGAGSSAPATAARAAAASAAPLPAPTVTIDSLLAQFRAVPGLSAHFREEKKLSLLAAPLRSEGTLHFAPPARLVRHTTAPVASTLLIDRDQLTFSDGQETQTIPLDGNPMVRLFVDSFLKILEGDKAALERIFQLQLKPQGDRWELRLKPRLAPMTQVIDAIVLQGKGVVLSRMTISESTGDETVTTFDQVDAARRYSPDELARLFAVPGR